MTRAIVRSLKRAVRTSLQAAPAPADARLGQECALALLERSIGFGHGRLAVLRLCAAVKVGAVVRPEHWLYCARVAKDHDGNLQQVYQRAVAEASGR